LLTEADGLPDNEVKQVARAPDASLWLACRRGLLRISREAALRVGA
jgi:ligand-binding sensor domain-containing protein